MNKRNVLLFLLLLIFASCSSNRKLITNIRKDLRSSNYNEAIVRLDKSDLATNSKNNLLYYMEKGTLLFLADRYSESITYFTLAKRRLDELFAVSISKQSASMISNDLALPYKGEDFEKVLIHYYLALDYLMLNNLEDALVECRQVNLLLNEINEKYKKKNVYSEDAFVRYLNGVLFEIFGELNDSYIDYYRSYKTYKNNYKRFYNITYPSFLRNDLLRLSSNLGLDDFNIFKEKFGNISYLSESNFKYKNGEIILIFENGVIPRKTQGEVRAPLVNRAFFKLVFPEYRNIGDTVIGSVKLTAGKFSSVGGLVEPLAAIAVQDLKDRADRIMARMLARATVKHGATEVATEMLRRSKYSQFAPLVRILGHFFSSATEKADTRGWYTLPHDIFLVRLLVAPGKYSNLQLNIYNRGDNKIGSVNLGSVTVKTGQRVFKYYRGYW